MNLAARDWAETRSKAKGAARYVLVLLATHANRDGLVTRNVGIKFLQERTGETARHLMRLLQQLEALGELTIERRTGRQNTYMVHYQTAPSGDTIITSDIIGTTTSNVTSDTIDTSDFFDTTTRDIFVGGKALTTKQQKPKAQVKREPPPPAHEIADDGGGGDFLKSDLEFEALLEELASITGLTPTNHERAVLAVTDYGEHRRAALRELRKAWPGVTHVGGWLNRVIARLKDEAESAKRPLFPIEEMKARWDKYSQPAWDGEPRDGYH